MSYDNAEPKVLKTLNSSGQVLNDRGNVINDTSDFWTEKYNQAEPKADKILHSDGTIKDSAGNLIQDTTPFNVKKYNQAEPIPAKYLHADGTIDENAGGAGANLEDNKEVEITENGEIEITPSSGYDGMKKVTANINVSGGGGSLNFNSTTIPSFMLISEDEYPDWNYGEIFAISENGTFIDNVENIPQAKFLIHYSSGGSWVFRKNGSDTIDASIERYPNYLDNCDFTLTDGKITLTDRYGENPASYIVTLESYPLGYWLLPQGS